VAAIVRTDVVLAVFSCRDTDWLFKTGVSFVSVTVRDRVAVSDRFPAPLSVAVIVTTNVFVAFSKSKSSVSFRVIIPLHGLILNGRFPSASTLLLPAVIAYVIVSPESSSVAVNVATVVPLA